MIENIRKYTGLMIVVLVLLFVGLVFLGDNVGNTFAGKPVMEVAGRGVSQKEFQRNAIDVQKIAMEIPNRTPLPRETRILASHYLDEDIIENPYVLAGSILQQMGMFLQPSDGLPERFLANRLAVQKAGIEYGVTPSDNEVESFVENVLFADEDGNFNQEASREFFDETAGKLGIGTRGFNEYIRDLMTTQNLSKLIGGGIPPEMETVRALYDSAKQSISVKQISLDSATFEAEVNPTEEEIKAFYEENKDKYNSEEQRKISYVFVEPDWATKLDEVTAAKAEAAKKAEEERLKMEADKKLAEEAAARANEAKDSEEKPETPGSTDAPAPTDTTESSETSEEGPQGQTGEPGEPAPAEEPTAPAEEPTAPAEEPAAPAEEPAAPAEEPTAPAEEPAAPAEEPAAPAEEPTAPAEEPTAPAEEPTAPAEEPQLPPKNLQLPPKNLQLPPKNLQHQSPPFPRSPKTSSMELKRKKRLTPSTPNSPNSTKTSSTKWVPTLKDLPPSTTSRWSPPNCSPRKMRLNFSKPSFPMPRSAPSPTPPSNFRKKLTLMRKSLLLTKLTMAGSLADSKRS